MYGTRERCPLLFELRIRNESESRLRTALLSALSPFKRVHSDGPASLVPQIARQHQPEPPPTAPAAAAEASQPAPGSNARAAKLAQRRA